MTATTLSTEARASIQTKMAAILEVANSDKPFENLTRLLTRATEEKMTYLPIFLQARISQLFQTDLNGIQAKVKAEFEKYYGTEVVQEAADLSESPLFEVQDNCQWPSYKAVIKMAQEAGCDSEDLRFIAAVKVAGMQYILVGDRHEKPSAEKLRNALRAGAVDGGYAYFTEATARSPIHEANLKKFLGIKSSCLLFGLEAPHEKCVGNLIVMHNQLLIVSKTGAQGTYSLEMFKQAFIETLLLNQEYKELWEAAQKALPKECEGIYKTLSSINGALLKLPLEGLAAHFGSIRLPSIPTEEFIKLIGFLAHLALEKHAKHYTAEQLAKIKENLKPEAKEEGKTSEKKPSYISLVLSQRDQHAAFVLLNPPVELSEATPRIAVVGRAHVQGVLNAMYFQLGEALEDLKAEGKSENA